MSGPWYEPVIRVNYSGIFLEGPEYPRNSPFPWRPANGENAAILAVPKNANGDQKAAV